MSADPRVLLEFETGGKHDRRQWRMVQIGASPRENELQQIRDGVWRSAMPQVGDVARYVFNSVYSAAMRAREVRE